MDELWERRWLRRHAMAAPFGVFFTTALLTYLVEQGQWRGAATGEMASALVDLGAVLYGMLAVLAERGFRAMFWALDKRAEWREKMRAEAQAEGQAEGHAAGLAEGLAEGRAAGHAEGYAEAKREFDARLARLTRAAREQGVNLEELPPG